MIDQERSAGGFVPSAPTSWPAGTGPAQYRQAHELPEWYAALAEVTPRSVWTEGTASVDVDRARTELCSGPAVLRDYTKPMKHYWSEAAFIPDVADAGTVRRVVARFLELREDSFVGGVVLRRYETFTSAEARTWRVGGRCVLIGAHPDSLGLLPPPDLDITTFARPVAGLGLPFVTVDLAQREDGDWRVVELGDGQVNDRPASLDPHHLLEALARPAVQDKI